MIFPSSGIYHDMTSYYDEHSVNSVHFDCKYYDDNVALTMNNSDALGINDSENKMVQIFELNVKYVENSDD